MSNKPVESLVDAVADSDVLAEVVEQHLERRPLPVDPAEADRIAERLHRRIAPSRSGNSKFIVGITVLALAASALVALRLAATTQPKTAEHSEVSEAQRASIKDSPRVISNTTQPVRFEGAQRSVVLGSESQMVASEREKVAVVLVQKGSATTDGTVIDEAHWGLLTRVQGSPRTQVFRDGLPPPTLPEDVWGANVAEQLESVRWQAMPERTLDTLNRLLEEE